MKLLGKTALVIFVMFLINSCNNYKQNNDLIRQGFKGKVKLYKETSYEAIEKFGNIEKGEIEGGWFSNYQLKFDENGNKIEEKHFTGEKSEYFFYSYKYDENGNPIERYWCSPDGTIENMDKYKYDKNGNLIEKSFCFPDGGVISKVNHRYDKNGYKIESASYDYYNESFSSSSYNYDENGNMIQSTQYNENGMKGFKRFKYDENGFDVEETKYDANGMFIWSTKYKYVEFDQEGNCIKKISFENDKPTSITEWEFEYY